MHRINTSNVAPDLFGAGKNGFRNGNKALGISATDFNAEFCNSVQEELANVIEPKLPLDINNRSQLLTVINMMIAEAVNGGDYKASVRVATTVAINLAAPGANIDGAAMVVNDRFLDKDNATLANRGIYIWKGAAVPATRALDADTGAEFNGGAIIPVESGTVNADTNWQITNDGTVTIGTTGLTFKQVGASVDASETVKGNVELATIAEAKAGTDTTRAVTPAGLAAIMVKPGTIIDFSGITAPAGYLACPLAATNISRTTYAELFAAIGTWWGAGDGATTFGMPWYPADYASVQANANIGTNHVGENLAHSHTVTGAYATGIGTGGSAGCAVTTQTTTTSGGASNRAAGVRVLKCVKY